MRISDLGARAVGVLGALTLLAGCAGGTSGGVNPLPLGGPSPNAQPSSRVGPPVVDQRQAEAQSNAGLDELLSASGRNVHITMTHSAGRGGVIEGATFSVQGKATGAVLGTFTASGDWSEAFLQPMQWSFNESFTITTVNKKIYGSVRGSGYCSSLIHCGFDAARALDYQVDGNDALRKASVKISAGDFDETLLGMGAK